MKLGVVANSHGNLTLLEAVLVMLVDQHRVDQILALETAAGDVQAVLRGRRARFPAEVPWTSPEFPDFVLASVLGGVVSTPRDEVARTARLTKALLESLPAEGLLLGGVKVVTGGAGALLLTSEGETAALSRRTRPTKLCPGHVRALEVDGVPASCAVLEGRDQLTVRFLDVAGQYIGEPELVGASG